MTDQTIYQELAQRTNGACMLGVVGPVRTGKSTFIKRFMELMVIPGIGNEFQRQRARDELPQCASGRSIMTAEPKFVPEEPVTVSIGDNSSLSVRLVDCVGYMVDGATGLMEDGQERMVTTPWFDHEITMTEAAEKGTELVIREHAGIGVVVTTDGSICDIPREDYRQAEQRVIAELRQIGKPFVVLLNSTEPKGERASAIAEQISKENNVSCLPVNCQNLTETDIREILQMALEDFPLRALQVFLPDWIRSLPQDDSLKQQLYSAIRSAASEAERIRDRFTVLDRLQDSDLVSELFVTGEDLGKGIVSIQIHVPKTLFYQMLTQSSGLEIENDGDLIRYMAEMKEIRLVYDQVRQALEDAQETGYGVIMPTQNELNLEEPQIVRQNGKYSVKLQASAPAIHLLRTKVECEVNPAIGGDGASEEVLGFLLQGFDGDINRIWESNIFGRSLNDLAEESITGRIHSLPEQARERLRTTMERLINEGANGLICILL